MAQTKIRIFQATDTEFVNKTGDTMTGALDMTDAAGPALLNEASIATTPTVIANKADLTTGMGGTSGTVSLISGSFEMARFDDDAGIILTADEGAGNDGGLISLTAGAGSVATGLGGAIDINAGAGNTTGPGGAVTINAGTGGDDTGTGGAVTINAGTGGDAGVGGGTGGALTLNAGAGGLSGDGGAVSINAGDGGSGGFFSTPGGNVDINAGTGGAAGDGGNVTITGGQHGTSSGFGGTITITPGAGRGSKSAALNLFGSAGSNDGDAGDIFITAGAKDGFGTGGDVVISASQSGGSSSGGFISLTAGDGASEFAGGAGGAINYTAGNAAFSGEAGGAHVMIAGAGLVAGTGGAISITAGIGGLTGTGGDANLTSGAGGGIAENSGALTLASGTAGATSGNSGTLTLDTGTAGGTVGDILFNHGGVAAFEIDATGGTAGFVAANASGPAILNEVASATNPTLIPNKADLDTGDTWISTNVLGFVLGGTGLVKSGVLDRDVTAATVANTVVETTLYTFTVPANILGTTRSLRLSLIGEFLSNFSSTDTYIVRVKYGATTIFSRTSNAPIQNATPFQFNMDVLMSNANATGAQVAYAKHVDVGGAGVGGTIWTQGDTSVNSSIAEDSTTALALVVTIELSAANAALTFTLRGALLELL